MGYVVTFQGARPSAREDQVWTQVRIQEAALQTGSWATLETQALSPLDTDPEQPQARDITTTLATIADDGWYRLIFLDAAGNQEITDPVQNTDAPASADLTTVEAVREYLQRQSMDTVQDPVIQSLIVRASAVIRSQIAQFLPAETAATKTFVWRGGPLALHPYFLRSVSAVSLDSDTTSASALTSSDWWLRPKPAPDGVYRWLRLSGWCSTVSGEREVSVTGDWGFPSLDALPADVQHWAIVTVTHWLRGDVSAFTTTFRLDDERLQRPEALPVAVVRGLAKWREPEGF